MIRDTLVLLTYEMNRRPELAALAARIDHLSDDEIRQAEVPLPWIRNALLQLKAKRINDAMQDSLDQWVIDGHMGDPIGTLRRWTGDDGYLRIGRGQLFIRTGQLLWLDRSGVWIDTIQTSYVDPKLKTHTVSCGSITRSEYYRAVRQTANGLAVSSVAPPVDKPTFEIYRPKCDD